MKGGHGALISALRQPGKYKSVSAFAPICHPIKCPWGQKAFTGEKRNTMRTTSYVHIYIHFYYIGYLGEDKEMWKMYDATEIVGTYSGPHLNILIDQGAEDDFLSSQLFPGDFQDACGSNKNVSLTLRFQDGYDHSYYFISTFINDHIKFHAQNLCI